MMALIAGLALLCLGLGQGASTVSAAPAEKPLNVILILVDDLGWTDFACFGSKSYQTPNIDRLAREGMKFTSAYAACTVCSPTRAAMMTVAFIGGLVTLFGGSMAPEINLRAVSTMRTEAAAAGC